MSCKYKYEGVIYTEEEITNIINKNNYKNIVVFKGALKGFYDSQTKSIFLTEGTLNSSVQIHESFHAFEPAIDLAAAKGDKTAITLLKELDRVIDESQMFNEQETIERYNNSKNFGVGVDPMISFKVPTFTDNTNINRVKDLPITSDEDGATFNLDGTSYEGKGLVVPVISLNTTQKGLSKELIAKFVTDNADKIGNDSVKVGIYKFKGIDKVSIDLNIVVNPEYKEVALAFGKFAGQESLFNLDNFQNEPTGESGTNPKKFTSEEFIEISNSLTLGEFPNFMNIIPENSSNYANLTEDGEGNFVFYHKGNSGYKTIKKSSGGTLATSREEAQALSKVGGLAMYYTKPEDGESEVKGESNYMVKIPMSKVYDFNTDNLNIISKAKELHTKEHPNKAFNPNTQVAYITKLAYELGYDMVVAQWKGITRAQSFRELAPIDVQSTSGNTIVKPFTNNYKSNSEKGYKSVISVLKQDRLQELYLEMNKETNKDSKYSDSAYGLHHEVDSKKLTQEEVTNRVNNSSISQELKDRYFEAIQAVEQTRKSILDFSAQSSQAYAPRQGESQSEYVKRMRREVAANLLGENSVAYFDRIAEENNLTDKEKKSFIDRVREFIKSFSDWIAKQLSFENLTSEEASKLTTKDVLDRVTTSILKGTYQNSLFEDLSQFNRVKVVDENMQDKLDDSVGQVIKSTLQEDESNVVRNAISDLEGLSNTVWSSNAESVKTLLRSVQKKSIEISLDLKSLENSYNIKTQAEIMTLLRSLDFLLNNVSKENQEFFIATYEQFMGIEKQPDVRVVKVDEAFRKMPLLKLETTSSDYKVFKESGLLKIAKDTYIKTDSTKKTLEEVELLMQANKMEISEDEMNEQMAEVYTSDSEYSLEEVKKYLNYKKYFGIKEVKTENKIIPQIAISNIDYLKTQFIADIYKEYLINKTNKVLQNLQFGDKGITLKNIDPISIQEMNQYLESNENLKNYFLINKNTNFDVINDNTEQVSERDSLINGNTLEEFKDNYKRINSETLQVKTNKNFITVNRENYERAEKDFFVKLPSNTTKFYQLDNEQPILNINPQYYTSQKVETIIVIKNKYTQNESKIIDDLIDCSK